MKLLVKIDREVDNGVTKLHLKQFHVNSTHFDHCDIN